MPRFLFVSGVPRSGTTALTQVLAAHEQIVLGMERFKALNLPARAAELTPDKFTEDAFFDFADGHTNIVPANPKWQAYYKSMRQKFGRCAYVGDKIPGSHLIMENLKRQFPNPKFVAIIRDIFEVAPSWEARARDKKDHGWLREVGAKQSLAVWNKELEVLRREVASGNPNLLVVEHRRFFGAPGIDELNRVLVFLALLPEGSILAAMARAHAHFKENVATKKRPLPPEVQEFIQAEARLDVWDSLTRVAGA